MRISKSSFFISLLFLGLFIIGGGFLFSESASLGEDIFYSSFVDWKSDNLVIDVSHNMPVKKFPFPRAKAISLNAVETAISGIFLKVVMSVRADSYYSIGDLARRDRDVLDGLISLSLSGKIDSSYISDEMNVFHARYIFPLYGNGGIINIFYFPQNPYPVNEYLGFEPTRDFTGYVIYAKGRMMSHGKHGSYVVNPAIFIKIFDEDMNVVLEKEMCYSSYLKRWGMVAYTDSDNEDPYKERIGDFPLRIKAYGIFGKNSTDIVIPNEVARKILVSSKNIEKMREGRILLIINHDKMQEELGFQSVKNVKNK